MLMWGRAHSPVQAEAKPRQQPRRGARGRRQECRSEECRKETGSQFRSEAQGLQSGRSRHAWPKFCSGSTSFIPTVTCALTHASAWELLVATILSAQSTDANVNRVTPELFRKYPTVEAFAALTPEQLEPDVRSTGFFRNKSKSVVGAAKKIVADFGGQVPDDMDKLLTLPGVARKTANVVLGSWFKKAEGVVVDTHVHRISRRLELTTAE